LVDQSQAPLDLNGTRRGRGRHDGLKFGEPFEPKVMDLLIAREQCVDVLECLSIRQVAVLGGILLRCLDLAVDDRVTSATRGSELTIIYIIRTLTITMEPGRRRSYR
jgi:hypothetical protein